MNTLQTLLLLPLLAACSHDAASTLTSEGESSEAVSHQAEIRPPLGRFESPSSLCTTSSGEGTCNEAAIDCLSVSDASEGRALVNLYSIQANQHICAMSLEMEWSGNQLIYRGPDNFVLTLNNDGQDYIFDIVGHPGENDEIFCGAHASLNGYRIQSRWPSNDPELCPAP